MPQDPGKAVRHGFSDYFFRIPHRLLQGYRRKTDAMKINRDEAQAKQTIFGKTYEFDIYGIPHLEKAPEGETDVPQVEEAP